MKFVRIVVETAKIFYDYLMHFALMGGATLLSFVIILPAPFTASGLWVVTQRAVQGKGIKWRHYGSGIKTFGVRNLGLSLVLVVGYVVALVNLWFYLTPDVSPFPDFIIYVIIPVCILATLLWTGIAFYAAPFLIEMESPNLRLILRNSLFLTLLNPLTTLLLIALSIALLVLCYYLPVLFLFAPGFIALLRLVAVRMCVEDAREKKAAYAEAEAGKEATSVPHGEEETV